MRTKSLAKIITLALAISFTSAPLSSSVTFPDKTNLKITDAPYLVSIWTVNADSGLRDFQTCTGALIDATHVLTAAHCVVNQKQSLSIVWGAPNLNSRGYTLAVADWVVHPRYSAATMQNDIAIIRLYYAVDKTVDAKVYSAIPATTRYLTIPKTDKNLLGSMRLYGFGDQQDKRSLNASASVRQDNYSSTAKKIFKYFNDATMIGGGFYYKKEQLYAGACYGDSGGPLVSTVGKVNNIVGIVSYGSASGCNVKTPTVYTRVSYYAGWIITASKEMETRWIASGHSKSTIMPNKLSLAPTTGNFLKNDLNAYPTGESSSNTYVDLNTDPGSGRADINGMMMQVYSNGWLAVNMYFDKAIDGCVLAQQGYLGISISTNFHQKNDLQFETAPGQDCWKNGQESTASIKTLPPHDQTLDCQMTVKPFDENNPDSTSITAIAFQFPRECLGAISQLWIRGTVYIDAGEDEFDVEPALDMWIGPIDPTVPEGATVDAARDLPSVSGAFGEDPEIVVPEVDPPTDLQIQDIKRGTGSTVSATSSVTFNMKMMTWSMAKQVDNSFLSGEPYSSDLSSSDFIDGITKGLVGMKVGGRRLLVIPPDLAYGSDGSNDGTINPDETLIAVIDLISID